MIRVMSAAHRVGSTVGGFLFYLRIVLVRDHFSLSRESCQFNVNSIFPKSLLNCSSGILFLSNNNSAITDFMSLLYSGRTKKSRSDISAP